VTFPVRRRFFVEKFDANRAQMTGDAAHHLGRVLRAQPGQLYELSDGKRLYLGRIEVVERDRVDFALLDELPVPQRALDLTLLLSIVKFDSFEWAIEKATELGVATIAPLGAARSEKALLSAAAKRAARWKKILLEASQQSRRLSVPSLAPPAKPEAAFAAHKQSINLMLSERPNASRIKPLLSGQLASANATAALAIGPEGGWTDAEFAAAHAAGFHEASLGQLILRTETAVVSAIATLNYALSSI
jgi:16S rRNA (uracil1498-N3)-methyltransferase